MITYEEICEIMGCDPDEIIKCDDGVIMSFGCEDDLINLFEDSGV